MEGGRNSAGTDLAGSRKKFIQSEGGSLNITHNPLQLCITLERQDRGKGLDGSCLSYFPFARERKYIACQDPVRPQGS